jgi:plastocyanin
MVTRRYILGAGVGFLAGTALLGERSAAAEPVEIRMISDPEGSKVHFDPIGLLIEAGRRVRWRSIANVHTTTAYHPKNLNHSLRIPETAQPWDSKYLLPGHVFEITLTVEGVYDFFCTPHEIAGMVGRIIVGKPAGPGTLPFDYFKDDPSKRLWQPVPRLAQEAFPVIGDILAKGVIHAA